MENIIERVAHFANIDTRRALGFPPRRLPTSDLRIPLKRFNVINTCVVLGNGIQLDAWESVTEFGIESNVHYPGVIIWSHGLLKPLEERRSYWFIRDTGCVKVYQGFARTISHHPDYNEDGSFKHMTRCHVNGTAG